MGDGKLETAPMKGRGQIMAVECDCGKGLIGSVKTTDTITHYPCSACGRLRNEPRLRLLRDLISEPY